MVSLSNTRSVMDSLLKRDRTEITPKDYFKRFTSHLILEITFGLSLGALLIFWLGPTIIAVGIAASIVVIPMLLTLRFRSKTRSIVVKGDTLILKNYKKRSLVTSLRSVKKIRTISLPGIYITKLVYNLDGKNRSTLVVNRSWAVTNTPEKLINKAIELSRRERKKKANRKPGSVN